MKRIYFVDLENTGRQFLNGKELLGVEDKVILFNNAARVKKIPETIVQEVSKFPCTVQFVNTNSVLKNTMDMAICTCLGWEVHENYSTAEYYILSRDNDYYPSMDYIRGVLDENIYVTEAPDFKSAQDYKERRSRVKERISSITKSKKHYRATATALKKAKTLKEYHNYLQENMGMLGTEVYKATKDIFLELNPTQTA